MSTDRQQTSDEWTAMVKQRNHRAKLERAAREWTEQHPLAFEKDIVALIDLLAATEQRMLEDAAEGLREQVLYSIEDEVWDNEVGKDGDGTSRNQGVNAAIKYLLEQAQERRP